MTPTEALTECLRNVRLGHYELAAHYFQIARLERQRQADGAPDTPGSITVLPWTMEISELHDLQQTQDAASSRTQ